MSDPSEQGGRPLASNYQQPEGNNHSPSLLRRRHRKDSASSDERIDGTKSTSSRRRPGTRKDTTSGPHGGSSRGDSSTMQPSTSPNQRSPEMTANAINYTRTGRISKAKKGLKVHDCECGKSYTRAEHLRRHKKNHASETLVCEYPDCRKAFYRLDLLQRHQERHSETGRESRTSPFISPGPSTEVDPPVSVSAPLPGVLVAPIQQQQTPYYGQVDSPLPENTQDPSHTKQRSAYSIRNNNGHQPQVLVQVDNLQSIAFNNNDPFNQNHSPSSGYNSPLPNEYPNAFYNPPYGSNRTRASSDASFVEPSWSYPSRSPTSATSTMAAYTWTSADKPAIAFMNAATGYVPMSSGVDALNGYTHFSPRSMAQRDEEEQIFLFPEQYSGMDQYADIAQYLDNYWRLFHPSFPIVHRSSFDNGINSSPMLRAAMIAIGAQYSNEPSAKRKSRMTHDRCLKLLAKRDLDTMNEPDRLCDDQAVFLIEVVSQYRARRAAKKLSTRFEGLYLKYHENFRGTTARMVEIASVARPESATPDLWMQWVDLTCQQRLLQCCFVLEYQQAALLARNSQPSMITSTGYDLPFPAHSALWDAKTCTDWALAAQQYAYMPTNVFEVLPEMPGSFDTFQSSVLIAVYYNQVNNSMSYIAPPPEPTIDHLLDPSLLTRHLLLTAKLVHLTPIRALLAVAGESWILSEKVPSPSAFNSHKATLRGWANGLWAPMDHQTHSAKEALKLAIEILQQATTAPTDSLRLELGADMGLYFAALVIWSITVIAHSRINTPHGRAPPMRHQTPSPLPYDGRNGGRLPATPSHFSTTSSRASQSPNPMNPTSTGLIPTSNTSPAPSHSMLLSEITATTEEFLGNALIELGYLGLVPMWPRDVAQWQQGCSALLRWVKMRLRSGAMEARDSVMGMGPTSASTGHGGDGHGELLDGVINVLEKMINRGWEGWGI